MKQTQAEIMAQCIWLFEEAETQANRTTLTALLQQVNPSNLERAMILPSITNKGSKDQIRSDLSMAYNALKMGLSQLPRSKVIYLVPATLAIINGKVKFFEIIINACPKVVCLTTTGKLELDAPLRCAVDSGLPALVATVLSNEHFIAHEFDNTMVHIDHIFKCLKQTEQTRSPEISRMLYDIIGIRIPLICAMRECNLDLMRTILTSTAFDPTKHEVIIMDCIDCARKYCNKPGVVDLLVASITV